MRSIMYQEIGWFDDPDHSPGVLTFRLQAEAASIRGAVGDSLAVMAQNLVTMIAGITMAFIYGESFALSHVREVTAGFGCNIRHGSLLDPWGWSFLPSAILVPLRLFAT